MKKIFYLFLAVLAATALTTACNDSETITGGGDNGGQTGSGEQGGSNEGGESENYIIVLEYLPAPGQFINDRMDCTTMEEAVAWAQNQLDNSNLVSLGAFGGYITVKAGSPITNTDGYDFGITGNSYDGSSEPGIVWVSVDANGNGIPDDEWFELKGSEFGKDTYMRNYEVTYFRSEEPGSIRWADNLGNEGEVTQNQFHRQNYYPEWVEEDSYTLKGSWLEPYFEEAGFTWRNLAYEWGYADNFGSDIETSSKGKYNKFDLANAVDGSGNPANIKKIDFIKVQNAIQDCRPNIGETSTEVFGFVFFD